MADFLDVVSVLLSSPTNNSERSDFIISSHAERARSLLTARGLSQLQNSMRHKSFHEYIFLVSANDVMEHFAFPGNIDFADDDQGFDVFIHRL